jgi:hypothetical protein
MLADNALSGLLHHSPERAKYISEAATPLGTNDSETVTTPLAKYISEAVTPLTIKKRLF